MSLKSLLPFTPLSFKRHVVLLLALLLAGLSLAGSNPARALSTTTVNTTAVADNPNDGGCDLWEALQAIADFNNGADTDSNGSLTTYHECSTGTGPHVIVFSGAAAGGTITLPTNLYNRPFSGLPFVTDDVTITGPVVIDGGGPNVNAHIFITNGGGRLTLLNMVVQNGYTSGGGGAILSMGGSDVINIVGSSFHNNKAEGNGGAINAVGQVNILASNFSGNRALGKDANGNDYEGLGGAIYVTGYNAINISLSNFAGNIATEGGGAIYTGADNGEISDTVFNGNIVDDDAPTENTKGGGAIYNYSNASDGGLTLIRSVFNGNLSFHGHGGAIYNASDGYLHVRDSSFNANIAGELTNEKMGGAIYNQKVLDIRRVAFIANLSSRGNGGAVANDRTGQAAFANTLFTGNGAPDGDGGAIWNGNTQQGGPASKVTLYNVTLSLNVSPNAGAAIFNETGSHSVTLANSIVDGIGIAGDSCNRGLTSQGYNIDSSDTCGLTQGTDQQNTDPKLEPPSFNGGPLASLLSQALGAGSPAIDAGNNTVCANDYVQNLDQRSDPRPKGATCDIGAYETDPLVAGYGSDPVQPGPIVVGNTSVGVPITNTFKIISTGNTQLQVSDPAFGGADPGEFSLLTSFPVSTSGSRNVVIRCAGTSAGTKTATLTLSTNAPTTPSVAYDVTCNVNPAPTPGYGSTPGPGGTLDFGPVFANGSAVQTLTFFETGNATLTVGNADLTGAHPSDFTFNGFNGTIPDDGPPVNLPITCTPSGFGLRTATLSLTTNDPTQPTVSYNLVCEGIPLPPAPLAWPGVSYINGQGGLNSLNGAYDVAISPDGLHAYVASYDNNTLTAFRRNATTGALTLIMSTSNLDMNGPQMVEVSPDGAQVYVTARNSDAFLVFNRNATTGVVTLSKAWKNGQDGVTGLDYPFGISVSPDGRTIYVTSFLSNALVTFQRDANGVVTFGNALVDNVNLYRPYKVAMSPDARNLYISGGHTSVTPDDGYVSVYERDLLTGALTFVQQHNEGDLVGCVLIICIYINGLSGSWGIDVSPDGQNVYVTGYYDDAVVRFIRDPFDGTLRYGGYLTNTGVQLQASESAQAVIDAEMNSPTATSEIEAVAQEQSANAINTEGLDGAIDVKVSPDGQYTYVTGYDSDALAVFARNPANGVLSQVQVLYPFFGLPALDGAREIGLSPDGKTVYLTGYLDDSVVLFREANPIPTLDSLLPASAVAGSGGLIVRVTGQNFVPDVVGQVNGADRPTNYISPNEIEIELTAADVANAGTLTITAVNPAPGGGDSLNSLTFTVTAPGQNPIPSIDYLLPGGANAGDPALTLTVYGLNFMNGTTVQWNGIDRATTFVSSSEVQASVTAQDLLTPGTAVVTVVNPGPGGGTSNAVAFDVAAPGQNPIPTITSLDPYFTVARGAASNAITVRVSGQNFVPGAQALWNGQNRPTQYISETAVLVTLNSFDVAFGGSGAITVVNPGPGGGASNPATFIIFPYALYIPVIIR